MNTTPADSGEVQNILNKLLASGAIQRVPKNPIHRQVLMALVSLHLERRYPYTEIELKEVLNPGLQRLKGELIDHVTCRRYMVDLGFMKRDRAGSRYYLNYPKLAETLDPAITLETIDALVAQALTRGRG